MVNFDEMKASILSEKPEIQTNLDLMRGMLDALLGQGIITQDTYCRLNTILNSFEKSFNVELSYALRLNTVLKEAQKK